MKHIDQIKELLKKFKSIDELSNAIKQADIPAWYMQEADESFKNEHGIKTNESWHRFFIETDSTPMNKLENLPHYTILLISANLNEIKVIEKS
jgi:hypothetical protein